MLKVVFLIALVITLLTALVIAEQLTSTQTTVGTANVTKYVAIGLSTNLTAGIHFGSVDPNTNDNNATGNFNGTQQTQFWVYIDPTTNTQIDICQKVNAALTHTDGETTIPNSGFTWNVSTTNDANNPKLPGVAVTTTYDTTNLIANDQTSGTFYLRYWLDVPSAQKAGNYNNTVFFRGQDSSQTCGS